MLHICMQKMRLRSEYFDCERIFACKYAEYAGVYAVFLPCIRAFVHIMQDDGKRFCVYLSLDICIKMHYNAAIDFFEGWCFL